MITRHSDLRTYRKILIIFIDLPSLKGFVTYSDRIPTNVYTYTHTLCLSLPLSLIDDGFSEGLFLKTDITNVYIVLVNRQIGPTHKVYSKSKSVYIRTPVIIDFSYFFVVEHEDRLRSITSWIKI